MTTVYWNTYSHVAPWFEVASHEPIPAFADIVKSRDVKHDGHFAKCPAFRDYFKNTYLIRSPMDIEITYNRATGHLSISPQEQFFYDNNIVARGGVVGAKDNFLMSISMRYLFIADKECMIEQLPAFMHDSEFVNNTRIIPGTFDISKWYRPVEIAFELTIDDKPLKIKRGDPLCYVRLVPKDKKKVTFERRDFSEKELNTVKACLFAKDLQNRFELDYLYSLIKNMLPNGLFGKSKCPFNWRKK